MITVECIVVKKKKSAEIDSLGTQYDNYHQFLRLNFLLFAPARVSECVCEHIRILRPYSLVPKQQKSWEWPGGMETTTQSTVHLTNRSLLPTVNTRPVTFLLLGELSPLSRPAKTFTLILFLEHSTITSWIGNHEYQLPLPHGMNTGMSYHYLID